MLKMEKLCSRLKDMKFWRRFDNESFSKGAYLHVRLLSSESNFHFIKCAHGWSKDFAMKVNLDALLNLIYKEQSINFSTTCRLNNHIKVYDCHN